MRNKVIAFLMAVLMLLFSSISFAEILPPKARKAAAAVEYIADRTFFYYEKNEVYVIRFSLKDKDYNRICSPCTVEARLINSDEEEVYSIKKDLSMSDDFLTWTWSNNSDRNGEYATIYIKPEEIKKSKAKKGTMFIKVQLDKYFSFSEKAIEIDALPTIESTLSTPFIPVIVSDRVDRTQVKITEFSYEFTPFLDDVTIKIYISGEMTEGSYTIRKSSTIGWMLSDSDGYVIKSGFWETEGLTVGDKFKKEFSIYDVKRGEYKLEFANVV